MKQKEFMSNLQNKKAIKNKYMLKKMKKKIQRNKLNKIKKINQKQN